MTKHIPVLCQEIVSAFTTNLIEIAQPIIVDCTFGLGGHTCAILNALPNAKIIAIDRDPNAKQHFAKLPLHLQEKITLCNSTFGNLTTVLNGLNISKVDGILYDFGLSSPQLDEAEYGFSFNKDGELLMQMGLNKISAKHIVNNYTKQQLADIIFKFGEEIVAKRIANAIVKARQKQPIQTTKQLEQVITSVLPNHGGLKVHPATKTFQAIRIEVNNELDEIEEGIKQGFEALNKDCIMCFISFHSLEDRIVKQFINAHTRQPNTFDPLYAFTWAQPISTNQALQNITKKPIVPTEEEVMINPRSRSAKLRIIKKK